MAAITPPGGWTHGVALPIHTLTATLADPWEHTATVDDLVRIACKAEDTGHHFVGVTDHVAIPDNDYAAHMGTTWYDTVATLSYLAARTETVNLASVVWIAAYRHPLQTAKSFSTLDYLSGGRAILGVGAGHVEAEFDALGVDFDARGRLLDETLEAIRGAFDDQYVSHSGEAFSYSDVGVGPAPVREMPIWVGGSGRAAWRRAGRLGDGYVPMGNPLGQYSEIIDTMNAAAADAGRDGARFDVGFMPPWCYLLSGTAPEGLPPVMACGVEPVAASIRAGCDAGANTFHLKFRARTLEEYLDQFDAFAESVVPLVNEA